MLYEQIYRIDQDYTLSVVNNPLIQLLKTGVVFKKSDGGRFAKWEERFMMLTNCGLLYFKKGQEQPQRFKLLNNFIVRIPTEAETKQMKKQYVFRIIFNLKTVKKDLFVSVDS